MHKKVERNKNAKEAPVKKNDHMMDMARYFFASRPKYEDASYVPEANWEEFNARMGFSKAVDPEHRIDEGLTRSRSTTYTDIDFTLGGEW